MIKVLLYHENPILARGIETALSESGDILVGHQTSTEEGLWQALGEKGNLPDCLLIVIHRQDSWILVILDRIRKHHQTLPVLIVSIFEGLEYTTRLLTAGAAGVINNNTGLEELVEAIRKAAGGGRYVNDRLAEWLARHYIGRSPEKPHEILSRREFEVFLLLGDGYAVKEIAEKLGLSPKTISNHKVRIMKKMNLKSNIDIVRYRTKTNYY